nr:hypothetical protein [Bradyrhizobium sp. 149]
MALIGRVNFQVTVLNVLVSYPDGFAVMEDLKRDMAILATSGRERADRTKHLAAQVPDLDIFSHGLVERTTRSTWMRRLCSSVRGKRPAKLPIT